MTERLTALERKALGAAPETSFVLRKSTEGYWVRKGIPAGQWGVILNDAPDGWTVAHTPALALLAAMLRALGNTASPGSACSGDADTGEGRGAATSDGSGA